MLVFIAIGIAGLVVLLVSMLFGEFLDLLDGALSGTGLGAGLTLFGASGVLALANGWPAGVAYLIAAVAGVVTLTGVQLLVRRFVRSEDGVPSDPAGMTGVARTTITRAGGEVSLDGPYEVEARLATSDVDIPSGAPIRVVAASGPRVRVEPLDNSLHRDPSLHRKD
ncbi:NfeD family protein [Leifsonia sp. NPDC056824]|uniref:NfeD family protein n=1 Tax=Leifsonia sp. NPDC056824 TaxID=3345953 RepID=UPI0036C0C1AC